MRKQKAMKKIGIITVHRLPNWGSVLQAYALQKTIRALGYDVENIEYKYPNSFHWARGKSWGMTEPVSFWGILRKIKDEFLFALNLKAKPQMRLLNEFINDNLKLSRKYSSYEELHNNPPIYDIYVSGSDQIWNPHTMLGDTSYMFDFAPNNAKIISYASSFACNDVPLNLREQYIKYLKRYSSISVRENNGKSLIRRLVNKNADVVLDPTLLLNGDEWRSIASRAPNVKLPHNYILCYMLSYTYSADEPMNKLLTRVQKQYGWPIIMMKTSPKNFNGYQYKLPRNFNLGIPEFIYLMQHASLIVSSSFHGTAFALNLGRPLLALTKDNEDDRIESLVNNLGVAEQILVLTSNVTKKELTPFYDVNKEQSALSKLRQKSINYLSQSLNEQ